MVKRRSQQEWQRLVATWARSHVSRDEFCRRHGLSPSTLGWWQWRLAKAGLEGEDGLAPRGFVEAVVTVPSTEDGGEVHRIEVQLPGELVVRVERGFDAETLLRVVRVLAGAQAC